MQRVAVAVAIPRADFVAVHDDLVAGGYEPLYVETEGDLERLLGSRNDVRVAVLDAEKNLDLTLEVYGLLHDGGRNIPALIFVPPQTFGLMSLSGRNDSIDEYMSRPFSEDSPRRRIDAMLIRRGDVLVGEAVGVDQFVAARAIAPAPPGRYALAESQRGRLIVVFNPKGGVGKTTVSINLAAALQLRKHYRVLLVDCDAVTGHVAPSLGLPQLRTLAEAWMWDDKTRIAEETVAQVAATHSPGLDVLVLTATPFHTEVLLPERVAAAVSAGRAAYDFLVLDLHPDFGPLNVALFELADKIIVPITPDVPCMLAAVRFREIATALNLRDRLLLVINRADSGIEPSRVEEVVGIPTLGRIRSAGTLFYMASDAGISAVERSPDDKAIGDIDRLADRLLAALEAGERGELKQRARGGIRGLFNRGSG